MIRDKRSRSRRTAFMEASTEKKNDHSIGNNCEINNIQKVNQTNNEQMGFVQLLPEKTGQG